MVQETLNIFQILTNQYPCASLNWYQLKDKDIWHRHKNSVPLFNEKHEYLKNSFFPLTKVEISNLDSNTSNCEILALFRKRTLAFKRPSINGKSNFRKPRLLKLITRLRIGLINSSTLNFILNYGTVVTKIHYLFNCPNLLNKRLTLFNKL